MGRAAGEGLGVVVSFRESRPALKALVMGLDIMGTDMQVWAERLEKERNIMGSDVSAATLNQERMDQELETLHHDKLRTTMQAPIPANAASSAKSRFTDGAGFGESRSKTTRSTRVSRSRWF